MPSKPNFNYQRAERDRARKALKETKSRERKEQALLRKASQAGEAESGASPVQDSKK